MGEGMAGMRGGGRLGFLGWLRRVNFLGWLMGAVWDEACLGALAIWESGARDGRSAPGSVVSENRTATGSKAKHSNPATPARLTLTSRPTNNKQGWLLRYCAFCAKTSFCALVYVSRALCAHFFLRYFATSQPKARKISIYCRAQRLP